MSKRKCATTKTSTQEYLNHMSSECDSTSEGYYCHCDQMWKSLPLSESIKKSLCQCYSMWKLLSHSNPSNWPLSSQVAYSKWALSLTDDPSKWKSLLKAEPPNWSLLSNGDSSTWFLSSRHLPSDSSVSSESSTPNWSLLTNSIPPNWPLSHCDPLKWSLPSQGCCKKRCVPPCQHGELTKRCVPPCQHGELTKRCVPPCQQGEPTKRCVPPCNQQGEPTKRCVPPCHQQGEPTKRCVPPCHQQGEPTKRSDSFKPIPQVSLLSVPNSSLQSQAAGQDTGLSPKHDIKVTQRKVVVKKTVSSTYEVTENGKHVTSKISPRHRME